MISPTVMKENARHLALTIARGLIRYRWLFAFVAVALLAFGMRFTLAINLSESLPERVFLIDTWNKTIDKGTFVAFGSKATSSPYGGLPEGITLIKIVRGVAGDVVTHRKTPNETVFLINGEPLGLIKKQSRRGLALQAGFIGAIPAGFLFVYTPHADSLDSRYAEPGLIAASRVIGRAYPLF